eukprot:6026167-Prymnesium_polylepis.1
MSEYTADADGMGVLRLLNAIRTAGLVDKCRFYQVLRPTAPQMLHRVATLAKCTPREEACKAL